MELNLFKRTKTRSEIQKIRRQGDIPGVVYGKGKNNENIFISGKEFRDILRTLPKGKLATTRFTLKGEKIKIQAILKDIQYAPNNYSITHIDFQGLSEDNEVSVSVPIRCVGEVECEGVKLGGALRVVIRSIRVRALPKNIPEEFVIDVRNMGIGEAKRLSDISFPAGVRPLVALEEVVLVVAKH